MTGLQVDTSYPDLVWRLVILAAGMGLVMAPATDSVMGSLPLAKAGVGSAVNDTTRQVGGALGVAIIGSVVSSVYGSKIADFFAGTPAPKAAVEGGEELARRCDAVAESWPSRSPGRRAIAALAALDRELGVRRRVPLGCDRRRCRRWSSACVIVVRVPAGPGRRRALAPHPAAVPRRPAATWSERRGRRRTSSR